jgi:RimJ/RimL family protein N-acetyltransferase
MQVQDKLVIVTERLRLRPFIEADWSSVHEYAVDPQISKFQEWGPNTIKDTKSFVAKCIAAERDPSSNVYFFSITLAGTDRHIGGCVITIDPETRSEASIGYTINQNYWRKGYAIEAAAALLGFAFTELGLRVVKSNCDSANTASWRVMEKIGMRLVNTEFNSKYIKGSWRDWLEYSVSVDEWKSGTH